MKNHQIGHPDVLPFCNLLPSQRSGIHARRWQLSRRQAPSNRFSQSLIDLPIKSVAVGPIPLSSNSPGLRRQTAERAAASSGYRSTVPLPLDANSMQVFFRPSKLPNSGCFFATDHCQTSVLHRDPPAPIFGVRESSCIDHEWIRVNCFAPATSRRNVEGQNLLKCLLLSTPR